MDVSVALRQSIQVAHGFKTMDFLDPQNNRSHLIKLFAGYLLVGLTVVFATMVLLYWAYGFGLDKDGKVVQNGLVFVSSKPGSADVYLDGKKYKDTTSTRIQLNEGTYSLDVKRTGYRPWHRDIDVKGSSVSRYDYPLLIPSELTTTPVRAYQSVPALATQSPDRHWLLVQKVGSITGFDVYDLNDPAKVGSSLKEITLPEGIVTPVDGDQSWKLIEWSTDNRRLILQHFFTDGSEYVLVDRDDPDKSINLTYTLGLKVGEVLSLRDKKYDKYYIHDPAAKTVNTVTLGNPSEVTPILTGAVAFKSYGADVLLYATEVGAPAGKLLTMLRDGDVTYKIREIGAGAPLLLDLAKYDGDWYVAVGASADNKVYIYKNPQATRKSGRVDVLVPVQILRVTAPNYLAFSTNTRFVMIENATSFAIYDAETDKNYTYATSLSLDSAQAHASWIDGHRISYTSNDKIIIFDYDNINLQTLVAASPAFLPIFDRNYENMYALTPPTQATGQSLFTATSLLTERDR
jgi:hypothetical protein